MELQFYRNGLPYGGPVLINDDASHRQSLNGEDTVNISFSRSAYLDLKVGDYVTVFGRNFYINTLPKVQKRSSFEFNYTVQLESLQYELGKVQYMLNGAGDFYLMGNAQTFLNLIVTNMNRVGAGWTAGSVAGGTTFKNLNFNSENCLSVLQRLCEEYELEFWLVDKQINLNVVGQNTGLTFEYGMGKGLYELTRNTVSSENIVTRLWAFGSERNIPANYRNYSTRLKFYNGGNSYVEQNAATYGIIEKTVLFDDIYPRRTGTISYVDAANVFVFRDSSMTFDLNSYLLPGIPAKIHFQTGNLAGYEFEISSYNNATKEFTIIKNSDSKAYVVPNSTLKPAVGDTYVLIDILMPQSYIDAAEAELLSKAQDYLAKNSVPRVSYDLVPDPLHFEKNGIVLYRGDTIHTRDIDMGIDQDMRVISVERRLKNPFECKVEISTDNFKTILEKLLSAQEKAQRVANVTNKSIANNSFSTQQAAAAADSAQLSADSAQTTANSAQTTAANAQTTANNAQTAASKAQIDASTALNQINNVTSDNVLSAADKSSQRKDWDVVSDEKAGIDSQATAFGITTEKTNYDNAFQTLATYLNNGTTWTSGVPSWLADANLGTDTAIVGSTYRLNWKALFASRTILLNAITAKAKTLADTAQTQANTATTNAATAQTAANSAQTTANNAQTAATTALNQINNITSDNVLSAAEKPSQRKDWDEVSGQKDSLDVQATNFGVTTEKTAYDNAFQALADYLNGGVAWTSGAPSWLADANLGTDTNIIGATYLAKWQSLYIARTNLQNAITAKAKTLADNAQSTVDNMVIGGRNMVLNSGLNGTANWSAIPTINTEGSIKFVTVGYEWGFRQAIIMLPSTKYTVSALLRNNNASARDFRIDATGLIPTPATVSVSANSGWVRKSITFLTGPAVTMVYFLMAYATDGTKIDIAQIKLELGDKATEWTPAPEDIDANISTVQTAVSNAQTTADVAQVQASAISPKDDGLELRYRFDQDGIVQVADDSKNRYTGAIYGTKGTHWDWTNGISGQAFKVLSALNGYIQVAADGTGKFNKQAFTIAGWVKFHAKPTGTSDIILFSYDFTSHVSPYYGARLGLSYISTNDTVRVTFGYNSSGVLKALTKMDIPWATWGLDTWHHIAIAFQGGSQTLYLDGESVMTGTDPGPIVYYAQEVWIGRGNSGYTQSPFTFDDVRYYSRVLSSQEVLGLLKGIGNASGKTTLDGGVTTVGSLTLKGADGSENVGLTADGGLGSSTRIWAGESYANRSSAPFRVTQDGSVYADAGYIGGWSLRNSNGAVMLYKANTNSLEINADSQSIIVRDSAGSEKTVFTAQSLPALSSLGASSVSGDFTTADTVVSQANYMNTITQTPNITPSYDSSITVRYKATYAKNPLALIVDCRLNVKIDIYNGASLVATLGSADTNFTASGSNVITLNGSIPSGLAGVALTIKTYLNIHDYSTDDGFVSALGTVTLDWSGPNGTNTSYTLNYTRSATFICADGFASYWNSSKYFYLSYSAATYFLEARGGLKWISPGSTAVYLEINASAIKMLGLSQSSVTSYRRLLIDPSTGQLYYYTSL